MKGIITKLALIALLLAVCPATSVAQSKALSKAMKKEFQAKKKELKKGGWEIYGSDRSADVVLLTHYEKLNELGDDAVVVMGTATSPIKRVLRAQAQTDAGQRYAQQAGSDVQGRAIQDDQNFEEDPSQSFSHFCSVYETKVQQEIKGELKESYSIIRTIKGTVNGKQGDIYEMQTYYIVDLKGASQARIRAMQAAAKESEAAQKYAERVSSFIQEGFDYEP
ncbi:MAG: hypothetical protein K6B45_09960 [Bacteroidaceae bacterium]|nr:hypothetical protein [Bacteroidaceae bacterium]